MPCDTSIRRELLRFLPEVSHTFNPGRVSVRQINTYDRAIIAAFDLPDVRSGNGRRYAQRDPIPGRIVHAFGFELTGIAQSETFSIVNPAPESSHSIGRREFIP